MKKGFAMLFMALLLSAMLLSNAAAAGTLKSDGAMVVDNLADMMDAINNPSVRVVQVEGDIKLEGNIVTGKTIDIIAPITFDGAGYTITGADPFDGAYHGHPHVLQVYQASGTVTIKNLGIVTGAQNKHALNVYQSDNVVLENVKLNHEGNVNLTGAPLVINSSDISVKGDFTVVTGNKSWYGINVGSGSGLVFEKGSSVTFEDKKTGGSAFGAIDGNGKVESKSDNVVLEGSGNYFNLHFPKIPGHALPKTGDESQMMLWMLLMLASVCGLVLVSRRKLQS